MRMLMATGERSGTIDMQVAGPGERGITTVEEHEVTTWPATVGALAALPTPVLRDLPTLITYVKRIRDRRGNN